MAKSDIFAQASSPPVSHDGALILDDRTRDPTFVALVARQLEAILLSPMFDASERNRRFLRYIVEETLANGGIRIKGYSVGISVFDRESNFDPQIDPVVRIEAGRMRRSLERYYLTDGRCAPVRISVPKGGYVPLFELNPEASALPNAVAPAAGASPSFLDRPIFLLPFVSISGSSPGQRFADGLSEELIVEFGRHDELNIFTLPCLARDEGTEREILKTASAPTVLCGSIRLSADRVRVIAHLVDHYDNRHLWSGSFDRKLKRVSHADAEREIARDIVSALLARRPPANRVPARAAETTKRGPVAA
jgi:TolB-like protein